MLESLIDIFAAIFAITLLILMASLVFILIMHVLMPRKMLKMYFKEPYFSETEIVMFTGFPFGYMRTAMFMRALGFPASGEKRGVESAYKLAPVWYCKLSKYFIIFLVPTFSLFILSVVVLGMYMLLYE